MLSAVSIAFSNAQVIIIDKIEIPTLILLIKLPFDISFPMHRCTLITTFNCSENLGTNLSVIEIIKDIAGIILPNK
jgi:hypothetical protein